MQLRPPTTRDLRLASGLVLFTYIALHLFNHALGLVSVTAAELALIVAVRVWHSLPGTLLLYGAAATHVTLALVAIYRRRTLRMPPAEVLRIALGLGIPILVIGHVVATRIAWEAYRLSPDYSRIVWSLWTSDGEGRQLALLVPGWLHGCLGVNFAFGHRKAYQRVRPLLFAVALLLPVLGALGFLAMGKELAADTANRAFLDANAHIDDATRIALSRLRDGALFAWFALIGAIFAARELRAYVERRRNSVITITYPQRNARVPLGWTVLEASRSHHVPHMSMCGGRARCSTCRVEVIGGEDHCPPPASAEQATLERIGAPRGVRLACQLRPTGDIAVVPLLTPHAGAPGSTVDASGGVRERDVAVVRVVWTNRSDFVRSHLPQDAVYLAQLFVTTAEAALQGNGGFTFVPRQDAVVAIFGLDTDKRDAARAAMAAIEHLERTLAALGARCGAEFHGIAHFRVLGHAGPGAVAGAALSGSGATFAGGEAFDTLDGIEGVARSGSDLVVVSDTLLSRAEVAASPPGWCSVAVPVRDQVERVSL